MDRYASRVAARPLALANPNSIAIAIATAIAIVSAALVPASAQTLATLHVRSFELTADRTDVRVGEPLHLVVSAHVAERIPALDNVTLPDLAGFDVLGDERRCTTSKNGSDCSETLTVAATVAGDRAIGPTTMDAVDARNGKPSRFATNRVTLHVAGAPPSVADWAQDAAFGIARAIVIVLLVATAALALVWGFGKRPRPLPAANPEPPQPPAPPPPEPDAATRWAALVAALAAEPTRTRARAVRAALRERVGARDDETLGDLFARRPRDQTSTYAALRAIERASFCEESDVAAAVQEAMPFLNR